jgi:hypothetical protein
MAGNVTLPYNISLSPFVIAFAGTPYNITVGQDLNSDSIFNDRPVFGPANGIPAGQVGSNTIAGCGSFISPTPGQAYTPIPINYCTGPARFSAKTFGFGRTLSSQAADTGPSGGGPPGGGGHRGGGPGGRGGGPFGGGASTGKRFNLMFGVQIMNLFNNEDLSTPNGTLGSQKFGLSTQLAGRPFTGTSALRQIALQTRFTF